MFIIERRTAGVLAALAIAAVMVVLGNVWDPADVVATSATGQSTPALAMSVGAGVRPLASTANQVQTAREMSEIPQSK
jgi:hypothetical protein